METTWAKKRGPDGQYHEFGAWLIRPDGTQGRAYPLDQNQHERLRPGMTVCVSSQRIVSLKPCVPHWPELYPTPPAKEQP